MSSMQRTVVGALLIGLLGACSPTPSIPAKGTAFGVPVATTVDAEIARYYLESYLQGRRSDPLKDEKIDALYAKFRGSTLSREALKAVSEDFSVDFASLFLADRLLSDDCNRNLNQAFADYVTKKRRVEANFSGYTVLFVPGWDYAENGRFTGADFARPRELASQFGLENYLVELPPTGSVEQNAAVVAAAVKKHGKSGKKLLIAGASSGGPAIHLALSEHLNPDELRPVKVWLNLGGILQGSPLIDLLQDLPQRWLFDLVIWFKGWEPSAILSMATGPSRARYSRSRFTSPKPLTSFTPEILIINYLGVPLSGQLSKYSGDKYPLLRPQGPNDGLTLLTDVIAPQSLTVIALGSDHFFAEDPQINEKTVALMQLIVSYVERDLARGCREVPISRT